ncbi:MAG TPA: hydroxysqualene dehydroxylase HpnE [Candidatus Acidoferrales bacterium]|nr:hydroxysqualene dehydroxylase HpnE [Candidatus Acidoferrales bacterium]
MSNECVNVIGGGLAGLSAAVALAEAGVRVRLFEKRPYLGGRATSYLLPDGSHVDNCQHVTLGCCTNLADFYRRVGSADRIRYYDQLYFADARGRRYSIGSFLFAPPFHMALSFLRFTALSWSDKAGIGRAMLAIARSGGHPPGVEGNSMLDWLHRMGQTAPAIERFWRVVLVSALDEELARTDAHYGIDVFWKAFLANRDGFRVGIPAVPLAELYDGCRVAIENRGGEVRFRATLRGFRMDGQRVRSLVFDEGAEIAGDAFVFAVPQSALLELLGPTLAESDPAFAGLQHLHDSPITGIHFWFDRPVMKEPFLTLLDHTVQWIFNKTLLYAEAAQNNLAAGASRHDGGQYLQLVVSASYDLVNRSRQEITDLALREVREVLPAARDAKLVKATVIKEIAATFSPEPGSDQWRPGPRCGIENLFLAGDWTRTGWPATMEGAVRSGYIAAEAVLAAAGTPRSFLQPDLPAEGFSARWARNGTGRA